MCFKKFRECVLRAYACIMRTLFPTYCVKCLTVRYNKNKKNQNAGLFLPGVEKEMKAIEKLGLDANALQNREWSYDTRVKLLEQGNFALVSRIHTEKELDIVVKLGYIQPIIGAIKAYTPSKRFLQSLIQNWDREKLLAIVSAVPSAFDSLKAWEILGVEEKQAYTDKDRWAVAQALAKVKPDWAPKFITEVMKIVPSRLNEEALEALKCFVEVAIENKVDISKDTPYLMVIHPDLYMLLRKALAKDQSMVAPYVRVMFPQLVDNLVKNFGAIYAKEGPSAWARSAEKLTEAQEAAVWLFFALRSETIDLVVDNLSAIKSRVSEKAFHLVEEDVFELSTGIREILILMDSYKDDEGMRDELREKLLKTKNPAQSLSKFYPFNEWKKEQAEKAVRAMAVEKKLPLDRLSELSHELQAVAMEELEIQSEIAVIRNGTSGEKEELMKQKLHSRSEKVLFYCYYGTLRSYALSYVANFCMDESSFADLVTHVTDERGYSISGDVEHLVELHAKTWGLSEKNYRDLMQSKSYSGQGALLKKYVNGNKSEKKVIVINGSDDDDVPGAEA